MDEKYENILTRIETLEKNERAYSVRMQIAKMRDDVLLKRVKELECKTKELEEDLQNANREIYKLKAGVTYEV